ncbi:MAG: hypothetical protein KAG89_12475 [Fulvimarina manganoxydans]|uniref:hypothetical protein n=1 Tax=Fulvimarina manganoxydans TaxID=937218 RepID=UPI0023522355|nr:hypothetical protein [Fulvimarina manganoxydans]MCK5932975.1 hypothetical protein [Fulvimarina manganoxydans]
MDLKEFIVSAITEIAEAVEEADSQIKSKGGLVNPGTHRQPVAGQTRPLPENEQTFVAPRTTLNFDVAVTADSSGQKDKGAKAKIWVVEASIDSKVHEQNKSVSRLTFSIDVVLPHDKKQNERAGSIRSPRT